MEIDERSIRERGFLLDHIARLQRPPAWFYEQLEQAIALAAEGRAEEMVELDSYRQTAGEVVDYWDLEEFVERARNPPPEDEEEQGGSFDLDVPF